MRNIRQISLCAVLAISMLALCACSNEAIDFKKGEQAYAIGEYYNAAAYYKKSYTHTPSKDKAKRAVRAWKMGECYRLINYPAKSVAAYQNAVRYGFIKPAPVVKKKPAKKSSRKNKKGAGKKVKEDVEEEIIVEEQPDSFAVPNEAYLYLAQQQLKLGNYKGAMENFNTYLSFEPGSELGRAGLLSCELGPQWKEEPNDYTVKKEALFNSRRSDYSPMLYGDDSEMLLITSTRTQSMGEDLSGITGVKNADMFLAKKDEAGKWKQPEEINSEINTEYDDGASCISPDGKTMYFTRCSNDPSYPRYPEIFKSTRSDASWSKATKCELSRDTLSTYAHPAISPDGEWLYFVSDMDGGVGGLDIWRIRIQADGFGGAENLGRPINTPGNEMFPSFRPNGDLYFSSDGHPGMGGLDIFMARNDSVRGWTVTNQQYPLNSPMDDFGMTFEGLHNRGFFSSSRNDGKGWEHIYSFEKPEILQTLTGWVYEKDGYELPQGMVYMVGDDGTNEKLGVKSDGSFTLEIKPGVKYLFLGTCKGYLNVRNNLLLPERAAGESHEFTLQFALPPINIPVLIDNIFYEFDKATLTEASTEALDQLVTMMEENPNITIELSAHCDYRGNDDYNKRLSQRRAESVVNYMIEHGVKKDRMTPKGYGEERPKFVRKKLTEKYTFLNEGDTLTEDYIKKLPEDQQEVCNSLNRRTEFKVLRTTYGM